MGNLVEIARFYDPEEAYCVKSFLLSNGIDSYIQNDYYLTMAPWLRIALSGYGVQVMATHALDARELLAEIGSEAPEVGSPANNERIGPTSTQNGVRKDWLWLPVAIWSGIPFVPKTKIGGFNPSLRIILSVIVLLILSYWAWGLWMYGQVILPPQNFFYSFY
ncbi:hypothetical protein [Hyphococcus sp.]|uniref:hypothetical protein n=1 Tax=Hyphococcus sp. TaxID=2038636 RepID=UPI003CCC4659